MSQNQTTVIMQDADESYNGNGVAHPCESTLPKLTIEVVTDQNTFASLRDNWNTLADAASVTIYQTFEWQYLWWKHFGAHASRRLHLILFRHFGRLVGIAPFFLEQKSLAGLPLSRRLRLMGCGVLHSGSNGMFTHYGVADYLDILSLPEYETAVARNLIDHMTQQPRPYDEIECAETPEDGFIMRVLAPALERQGMTYEKTLTNVCPRIHTPADMDTFVSGCSRRHRRQISRASRAFSGEMIETIDQEEAVPGAIEDLVRLHQRRWNHIGAPGVFANRRFLAFQNDLLRQTWACGRLWIKRLRMDEEYIAVTAGFTFKGRFYDYLSGYDPASPHAKYSPALALQMSMINDAIGTNHHLVDLLRGDEAYKFEMTSDVSHNWKICIPNTATQRSIRIRASRMSDRAGVIVQRISMEGLLLKVHYREHGMPAFIPRYLETRLHRLRQKNRTPVLNALRHPFATLNQWKTQMMSDKKMPL